MSIDDILYKDRWWIEPVYDNDGWSLSKLRLSLLDGRLLHN